MKFIGVCLITEDVSRLTEFYRDVLQTTADGDDTHVIVDTKGAGISIFSRNGMEDMVAGSTEGAGNSPHTLVFEVEDVDAEFERLKEMGADFLMLPATQPWGCRALWFRDPDGNIIDFVSNVQSCQG